MSLEDARKALEPFYRHTVESVPLGECYDRVLAEDVYSKVDVPGFDRASMDGYAVKAADTWGADEEAPKTLRLIGIVHAGDRPGIVIKEGTAADIATGAVMPAGANAVVMVENTDTQDGLVNVRKPVTPGENVMHTGADVMMGELVLREGTTLTSREVSVLAAVGLDKVAVYKKPVVAILSTGNELSPPGTHLEPGQIFDVNAYAIGAGVEESGGVPLYSGIIRDTPEAFMKGVLDAVMKADIVLTSGSTSAGASDMMFSTVGSVGRVLVHGIKIKPGKPTIIGEAEGKPFIGLPGYPSSALTIFNEVVAPLIRHNSGRKGRTIKEVPARMALRVTAEGGREVLQPVGLLRMPGGLAAYPIEKGSGAVTGLLDADGYVEIGEDVHVLEEGEQVKVRLFSDEVTFPDLLIIGSHCLGIDVVARMMAARGFTVRSVNVGSAGGLRALRKGIADVAGIHLLDEAGTYNESFVRDIPGVLLVKGYIREQGLIVAKGNPLNIKGVPDLAGKRFINRTKGSGTRTLLDLELARLAEKRHRTLKALADAMPGYDVEAKTHSAVASAILTGKADVGLGIKTVADQNGLGFIPLRDEEYDFAVQRSRMDKPAVKAFLDIIGSSGFKKSIEKLGYRPRP